MEIYYTINGPEMINVEYQLGDADEKEYDFFKSLTHFNAWAEDEYPDAVLIQKD